MSKKLSQFTTKTELVGEDWLTGLDTTEPPASQNTKITKDDLFKDHAKKSEVAAVQANLDAHTSTGAGTAHPDGVTQTDLSNHKTGLDQHPISGVTGLQAALDAKENIANLGDAAYKDTGTLNTQVAAGDAPAAAVTGHESTYAHANLPTAAQKAALNANPTLSGADPVAAQSNIVDEGINLKSTGQPVAKILQTDGLDGFTYIDTPSGGGGGSVDSVNGSNSINANPTTGNVVVSLEGDSASPGNNVFYGTNGVGARGHHTPPTFGSAAPGYAPASGGGTTNFLRADGAWAAPPAGDGGWDNGSTITDWGDTAQTISGAGSTTYDLDNGHFFEGSISGNKTVTFESTANHLNTSWDVILETMGNTVTWQFTGATVNLPDGYDISANATYWFTFRKVGTEVYVSERKMQ